MCEEIPAPLVPPDLDLRSYRTMPLDVKKLAGSDLATLATGDEFRAAVLLWGASWHEIPASSLPNDDRLLAKHAGFGRDLKGWLKVKEMALHNFELCSDGRIYHPLISDLAISAAAKKRRDDQRTKNATNARWRRNGEREHVRNGERDDDRGDQRNEVQVEEEVEVEEKKTPLRGVKENGADAPSVAKKRKSSTRGSLLPDDFEPRPADNDVGLVLGLTEDDLDKEFEKFKDWARSSGSLKKDWHATWRNWLREAAERKARNGKTAGYRPHVGH